MSHVVLGSDARVARIVAGSRALVAYDRRVRLSQFRSLVEDEFGAEYADTVLRTQSLHTLGSQTASEALTAGVPPRRVWQALCETLEVPDERRLGRDHPPVTPGPD